MVMGAYARKHSRYHRSVECETDGALQILWNLWELHRFAKILQICETGVMEKQETQRPNVLADVEEIYEYSKDTSTGVSKDISEKCVLGKWLIEEPYALIGHVRFCEGLLRLEPLIAKQYMMKGCEKVETKSTRRVMENSNLNLKKADIISAESHIAVYARFSTQKKYEESQKTLEEYKKENAMAYFEKKYGDNWENYKKRIEAYKFQMLN